MQYNNWLKFPSSGLECSNEILILSSCQITASSFMDSTTLPFNSISNNSSEGKFMKEQIIWSSWIGAHQNGLGIFKGQTNKQTNELSRPTIS